MVRLMSAHRSGIPFAYLSDSGNGGDGPVKGEEEDSGADVASFLHSEQNTQHVSVVRASEQPLKVETAC